MEYGLGILGGFIGALLFHVFVASFLPGRDKTTRIGLQELAKQFNRDIHFYDALGEVLVHVKDFKQEAYCRMLTWEQGQKNVEAWNKSVDQVNSKADGINEKMNMLMKHLGLRLELVRPVPPSQIIVKVKKR